MKKQVRKILTCLLFVAAGAGLWSSCSPKEEEAVAPKPGPPPEKAVSNGSSAVMFQAFTLFHMKWPDIQAGAPTWAQAGFNWVWFPPASRAADTYGYLPTQWYDFNNWRGTHAQLTAAINAVRNNGMLPVADVVLNHRNGNATAGADFVNPAFANNAAAVTSSDECGCGTGGADTGNDFNGGRDLNHNNASVNTLSRQFVDRLASLGFGGARYDMVLGYKPSAAAGYKLGNTINVGEYWVDDRNAINNWLNAANMQAFDFTTYNRLRTAVAGNYSVLNNLPGLIGINKSRAITFAGNHDTPSTGHIGLTYVLTHPGIPCVHIDEWQVHSAAIRALIGIRKSQGIGQTSNVAIQACNTNLYAAIIDGKVAMKIGPGAWSPTGNWTLAWSGTNAAVWVPGGGGTGNVTVTLRMLKDVGHGNALFFSGNNAALTNWGTGVQGTWTTGNYWTATITVPAGTTIEYKARLGPYGGAGGAWETGSNHVITNPTNGATYTATFQGGF